MASGLPNYLLSEVNFTTSAILEALSLLCPALCLVAESCQTLCNPMDWSPPGSSFHGDSPGKNTGVGCHVLLQGIEPRSPTLQADSLLSEAPGNPIAQI